MAKLGQYNLDEMTEQEAFEASATHLLEQSVKSKSADEGVCLYNGDDKCCAAGIFIQGYEDKMEYVTWRFLVDQHGQSRKYTDLVCRLQKIHDINRGESFWLRHFYSLGKEFALDCSFLDVWSWSEEKNKYVKEQ